MCFGDIPGDVKMGENFPCICLKVQRYPECITIIEIKDFDYQKMKNQWNLKGKGNTGIVSPRKSMNHLNIPND